MKNIKQAIGHLSGRIQAEAFKANKSATDELRKALEKTKKPRETVPPKEDA